MHCERSGAQRDWPLRSEVVAEEERRGGSASGHGAYLRVVGVEHGQPIGWKRGGEFCQLLGKPRNGAEILEMRCANIGDDADAWACKRAELADFAWVIGAHLQHGITMRWLQATEGERQPEGIVIVAPGAECWRLDAKHVGNRLFAGGLPGCSGDGDNLGAPAGQDVLGVLAERQPSIGY